jgi:nonribosomal peptide synthetase DhbF
VSDLGSASIREVEAVLAAFPGIARVTVTEQDARPAGQCLVAYVAPGDVDMPALHAHARKLLPGHLVPTAIMALDAIPVTPDGTADVHALPEASLGSLMPYRAPGSARQEALCEIFAEVLRVPRFGVDDDFFNLGGRSVEAMLLAGRISAALGVQMSMADLFDAPTVAELDRRLDSTAA